MAAPAPAADPAVSLDTLITAAGVLIALAAFLRARRSDQRAAKDAQQTQELRAGVAAMQRDMVDALQRLASAQERAAAGSPPSSLTASAPRQALLSATLEPTGTPAKQLVVTNIGDGPATVTDVQVLEHPEVVVGDTKVRGRVLEPGERLTMLLALSLATPRQVDVLMAWQDETGPKERVQTVDT